MEELDFRSDGDAAMPTEGEAYDTLEGESTINEDSNPSQTVDATIDESTEEGEAESSADYEALEAEDLAALRREFYEARGIRSIAELDDPVRFAELRELGLSPREAYLATKKVRRQDNRQHLRGATPKSAAGVHSGMTSAELSKARELFSGMSDTEIQRLYKRVSAH